MSDNVLIDRLQFTLTVTFHYLFPIITMGLALFVAWMKTVSYLGREDHRFPLLRKTESERAAYESASRFWAKIFGVNFAFGVVTGIPHGVPVRHELGALLGLRGRRHRPDARDGGRLRLLRSSRRSWACSFRREALRPARALVLGAHGLGGSWLSGYFIIVTNAWMQHPVGYSHRPDGSCPARLSFWAAPHESRGRLAVPPHHGGAVDHRRLRRGRGRRASTACWTGTRATPDLPAGRGHRRRSSLLAPDLPHRRPARQEGGAVSAVAFAAMEGLFQPRGAPLAIIGHPDIEGRARQSRSSCRTSSASSPTALEREVTGLDDIPARPVAGLGAAPLLRLPHHGRAGDPLRPDRCASRVCCSGASKLFTSRLDPLDADALVPVHRTSRTPPAG